MEKIKNSKITEISGILDKKIYSYKNGETAIFINNEKIIISDEVKNLHSRISKMVAKIAKVAETTKNCKIEIETWISDAIAIIKKEDDKNGCKRPYYFKEIGTTDNRCQPYCELKEVFEKKILLEIESILYIEYDIDIKDLELKIA